MKKRMLLALSGLTAVFILNALWLAYLTHSDRSELHASPLYPTYVAFRSLFLESRTIIMLVLALSAWLLLLYRKSLRSPLTEGQKTIVATVVLAVIYGFVLLASFKL